MRPMDDRLEILIGKFLDGEISPAEQRWLDEELERNQEARELLEQLQTISECSREAVTSGVIEQGRGPEEILERTWQRHKGTLWRRIVRADGHLRFAVGIAAGFLMGLSLHFALTWGGPAAAPAPEPPVAVDFNSPGRDYAERGSGGAPGGSRTQPVMRNVDWYTFTDQTGNQWLVEGVREGLVQPAAYHGDL